MWPARATRPSVWAGPRHRLDAVFSGVQRDQVVHAALFEPSHSQWDGKQLVSIDIPARKIFHAFINHEGDTVTQVFKGDLDCWIEVVCKLATERLQLVILDDRTHEGLESVVTFIAQLLSRHDRVELDRHLNCPKPIIVKSKVC